MNSNRAGADPYQGHSRRQDWASDPGQNRLEVASSMGVRVNPDRPGTFTETELSLQPNWSRPQTANSTGTGTGELLLRE